MIRKHENSVSWKAGTLSVLVHAALLGALLISFNWKAAHTVLNVTEVELWDKIPGKSIPNPPEIKPEPKLELKVEELKPEPPKPAVEEKPKPEEPKVDIELENKRRMQDIKESQEKIKKEREEQDKIQKELEDKKRKKLAQQLRDEDLKEKAADNKDALKKLQQDALNDEKGESDKQASAASAGLINEYKAKIQAKIKANVNKTLCGDGNPEVKVDISVLPTGQIGGSPRITKSSGNSACDEAIERAIIASEPLPLPEDASLKSQFRNLNLKFRPNEN